VIVGVPVQARRSAASAQRSLPWRAGHLHHRPSAVPDPRGGDRTPAAQPDGGGCRAPRASMTWSATGPATRRLRPGSPGVHSPRGRLSRGPLALHAADLRMFESRLRYRGSPRDVAGW